MTVKERMLTGDPFRITQDIYDDKVYFLMRDIGDPEDENYSYSAAGRGEYGVDICRPLYNRGKQKFRGFRTTPITLDDDDFQFCFDGEVSQTVSYLRVDFEGLEVFAEASKRDSFGIFDSDV